MLLHGCFSQLRILLKPVVDFPLENLILAESTQFRSSQLTRSGRTMERKPYCGTLLRS
jgi:hypothetical protein